MKASIIQSYFPESTAEQIAQFEMLPELYSGWNSKINVISRKDIDNIMLHHVLHSLAIARFISFQPGTKILDVGTGGGFPGIPLAIFFPLCNFTLVDSIGKKIMVVKSIAESLGLKNVNAIQSRAEAIEGKFDFVVSRATAPLKDLVDWVKGKVRLEGNNDLKNGLVCLKGGELNEEIKDFAKQVTILPLSSVFKEEFFETKKLLYYPLT